MNKFGPRMRNWNWRVSTRLDVIDRLRVEKVGEISEGGPYRRKRDPIREAERRERLSDGTVNY